MLEQGRPDAFASLRSVHRECSQVEVALWNGVDEGHHSLSHEPDSNQEAYEKLIKINTWYCQQVAHLANRLAATPEPGGEGSLLDNTTILWTNELGKGNSHTRDNIPFVLVGGGLRFKMGRALDFRRVPHNRLLMSLSEAMGHPVKAFGNPDFCADGPLTGYELYESPYLNSQHDSGLITIGDGAVGRLTLDFRNPAKPIRTVAPPDNSRNE